MVSFRMANEKVMNNIAVVDVVLYEYSSDFQSIDFARANVMIYDSIYDILYDVN